MQKTYTANYLTKQSVKNTGQLARYYIEKNHPPIIEPEIWQATQEEIAKRRLFVEEHGLRGFSGNSNSVFYSRFFCKKCNAKMFRKYQKGASEPIWYCRTCCAKIKDEELRNSFCKAFDSIVVDREIHIPVLQKLIENGTALEKLRASQMIKITHLGTIPYEIPELTQAVLQEAWLMPNKTITFKMLSGESISIDTAID